ncbi:Proteasome subunit beta type-2-A [Asimina triloba]
MIRWWFGALALFELFVSTALHILCGLYILSTAVALDVTTTALIGKHRGELATALRKSPYLVNILMAGYDKETGPSLYYIDYIATLHKIDKGAFGYESYFSLAMMDMHYHKGMSVEDAIDLVDKCIIEIRSRLVVAPPNFA